jgi:hypothetical protein
MTTKPTSISSFFNCYAQHPVCERIYSYINEIDKVKLAFACKKQDDDFLRLERDCSQSLMKNLVSQKEKTAVFLTHENGKQEKTYVVSLLDYGAFKGAWLLENGDALLLPNMGGMHYYRNNTAWTYVREIGLGPWKRSIDEEVGMSRYLSSLGLLTSAPRKVRVAQTQTGLAGSMPCYLSRSFAELAKQGIFVIDEKSDAVTTWKMRKITKYGEPPAPQQADCLFENLADGCVQDNWEPVFDSLITDIAKIYVFALPASPESTHKAVVRKEPDPQRKTDFEVRYFGFDFSHISALTKPEPRAFNKEYAAEFATKMLSPILDQVLWNEFNGQAPFTLKFNLKLKCVRTTLARMEELSKQLAAPSQKV